MARAIVLELAPLTRRQRVLQEMWYFLATWFYLAPTTTTLKERFIM